MKMDKYWLLYWFVSNLSSMKRLKDKEHHTQEKAEHIVTAHWLKLENVALNGTLIFTFTVTSNLPIKIYNI